MKIISNFRTRVKFGCEWCEKTKDLLKPEWAKDPDLTDAIEFKIKEKKKGHSAGAREFYEEVLDLTPEDRSEMAESIMEWPEAWGKDCLMKLWLNKQKSKE